MRSILFTIAMVFGLAASVHAGTVQVTWQYDYTANPPCTASVTTSCISGFNIYELNSAGARNKLGAAPNPSSTPILAAQIASNLSMAPGSHQVIVTASGVDSAGTIVESPASSIVTIIVTFLLQTPTALALKQLN